MSCPWTTSELQAELEHLDEELTDIRSELQAMEHGHVMTIGSEQRFEDLRDRREFIAGLLESRGEL